MKHLRALLSGKPWLRSFHFRPIQEPVSGPASYFPSRTIYQSSRCQRFLNRLNHGFRPSCRSPGLPRQAFLRYRGFGRHPDPPVNPKAAENSLSFSQRMRKLSREYGWSALGVYLFLSVLDFPLCFLAVRTLGAEKIGHWEHVALEWIREVVPWRLSQTRKSGSSVDEQLGSQEGVDGGSGVKETEERRKKDAASNASMFVSR